MKMKEMLTGGNHMTYPKPLSEKSLMKKYDEAKISEEEKAFLHRLFAACADLYGVISVDEIYELYRECSATDSFPRISKSKMISFSEIARRETLPYYVFEINEVYDDENPKKGERLVITRELVGKGYYRFVRVYTVVEERSRFDRYVPEDLLAPHDTYTSTEEIKLKSFLDRLESTADVIYSFSGIGVKNPYRDKKLKDFSYTDNLENYVLKYFSGNNRDRWAQVRESALQHQKMPASERLMETIKAFENEGSIDFNGILKILLSDLNEMGVELSEYRLKLLVEAYSDFHNHFHSWAMNGWSPEELTKKEPFKGPPIIEFGPGIEKMIASGEYDREELVNRIEEMGIKVTDSSKYGKS